VRVTIISKAFVVGEYQTKLEAIAAYGDVDLTAIVPPHWRDGRHRLELERAHTAGYEMVVAPMAFNGAYHWHWYPGLTGLLRDARPDLVHIDEEPYNLASYQALRAAHTVGARAIFFTWQNLARRYPPPFNWIERRVHHGVAGALAGNADAVKVLRAKGYRGPVRVVPQFGVDPERFAPAAITRQEPPAHPFTIGYAGRLVEEKGLWVLYSALRQLEGDWRAVLYGNGPLRAQLERRIAADGLSQRILMLSRVPSTEMPARLRELDVLALPSLTRPNWKEQFGRVLIEAMACGVPVVGSCSGEIPHVVGTAGLLFHEGDAAMLRQHFAELRADRALRALLGLRGRERALDYYTQAAIAEQTVSFYREVLASQPAPIPSRL